MQREKVDIGGERGPPISIMEFKQMRSLRNLVSFAQLKTLEKHPCNLFVDTRC